MNRKNSIYLALGLLLVVLVLWLIQSQSQRFSWRETYRLTSEEPYGCYALNKLLNNYGSDDELVVLTDSVAGKLPMYKTDTKSNYVFVGNGMYMRPKDNEDLLGFVASGNTAFIATKVIPFDLMFSLYYTECSYEPWDGFSNFSDTSILTNFSHPELKDENGFRFTYKLTHETSHTYWPYFADEYFCGLEDGMISIGKINDSLTNFVKIPYGEGHFYLHSNPQVFTNYFLVKDNGKDYAATALSHLAEGPIYWDEYSKVSERQARDQNDSYMNRAPERRLHSESPLQFVLEQPALAWAWYLLVASGLMFMIFRTRRRQRVIPVVEPKKNTSLEFLTTIGRLYYQRSNHHQVAGQAIKLFRNHVWEKYHLKWETGPQFIKNLSIRSGTDEALIEKIVKDVENIPKYKTLMETELVKFYQRLERFYFESR